MTSSATGSDPPWLFFSVGERMRTTAKYTLFIGFAFSSITTYVIMNHGTGFTTMTAVLYLYGLVCLIGGIVGYRKAYLEHVKRHEEPGLRHIFGLHDVGSFFRQDSWKMELKNDRFETPEFRLSDKIVSVRRELDGIEVGISYPRRSVVSVKKA